MGGREFPLHITTTPQGGATAYFIPYDAWLKAAQGRSEKDVLADRDFLRRYKVTAGKTPVTISAPSYRYVLVVEKGGHVARASDTVTPGPDRPAVNVELE